MKPRELGMGRRELDVTPRDSEDSSGGWKLNSKSLWVSALKVRNILTKESHGVSYCG